MDGEGTYAEEVLRWVPQNGICCHVVYILRLWTTTYFRKRTGVRHVASVSGCRPSRLLTR